MWESINPCASGFAPTYGARVDGPRFGYQQTWPGPEGEQVASKARCTPCASARSLDEVFGQALNITLRQDDNGSSDASGTEAGRCGPFQRMNAQSVKPGVKHMADARSGREARSPSGTSSSEGVDSTPVQANPRDTTEPLTDEQIADYRARMENGYYRSEVIRRLVAERLFGEMFSDRRRG